MKVKGLRWMVIGLIMLITIINYLDRGTLNYMWVANIDYRLVSQTDALADKGNHAVLAGEQYILTAANGNPAASSSTNAPQKKEYSANTYSVCGILMIVLGAVLALLGLILLLAVPVAGIIAIVFGVACVVIGRKYRKVAKERRANE